MERTYPLLAESARSVLQVASDVGVGLVLIAVSVVVLLRARSELDGAIAGPLRALVAFFLCCGFTYIAGAATLWFPVRAAVDVVQSGTAILTASAVVVFAVTTLKAWSGTGTRLRGEVRLLQSQVSAVERERELLMNTADDLRSQLDESAAALATTAQRFNYALLGSNISLFQQDLELRYNWLHNPPPGLDRDVLLGKTDEDVFPQDIAQEIAVAKKQVRASGESRSVSFALCDGGSTRHYDLTIHLLRNHRNESTGLGSVAVDVTEHRENAEKLRTVMRELAHRSKNLLAIIIGISNLTSKLTDDPREFHDRFADRLRSLSDAHDALTESEWTGADMLSVVERQVAPYQDGREGRVNVEGAPVWLKPNAVQYFTLVVHELITNAVRHGALRADSGTVAISWSRIPGDEGGVDDGLRFIWRETYGEAVEPASVDGFGKLILKRVAPSALNGGSTLEISENGVEYVLDIAGTEYE